MVLGIGVDLFEVARMERELQAGGVQFLAGLFSPGEIAYCNRQRYPARHYAARFAAKEAVLKAFAWERPSATAWREIEVGGDGGPPRIVLHGTLHERAQALRVTRVLLSLSHTAALAMAGVVVETRSGPGRTGPAKGRP